MVNITNMLNMTNMVNIQLIGLGGKNTGKSHNLHGNIYGFL